MSAVLAFARHGTAYAASPALPVPCAPAICGATGSTKFITSGAATAVAAQNALTVNQTTNSVILNWSSFDVGAGGSVTFRQPTSSSVALNRIFQASPSQIFGRLSANGQIYLVNLNGFVFGTTSTVNVGSLVASSLPLTLSDADFGQGILSPLQNNLATFDNTSDPLVPGGRASVVDANGKPVLDADGKPLAVQVVVQPGAQLTAADQGRLLLAGQNVSNGGSLSAPDGQVILAAGTKVFLQADSDPGLRGLVVEVDVDPGSGTASNQIGATLSAPRGNVTMVGLAVNQEGRISATTSVNANGSIRLEAADKAVISASAGVNSVASLQGGTLTLGPQSEMDILPELSSSATAVDAQQQLPSTVTLLGEQVVLQGGSIRAPGGTLTAIAALHPSPAALDPTSGVSGTLDPNARLRIDPGTTIDLSGSSVSLPVTANLLAVQLRSSELADDPTQRSGPLHGLTVYVDPRLGSPPIADLSGDFAAVAKTVGQRTETGGQAVFQSEGDVVFAPGATLNVSGGSASYSGGILQTSELLGTNGRAYPIATANPLLGYSGVINPTFTQTYNLFGVQDVLPTPGLSLYQPAYTQGANAGQVQFAAPSMVLQGRLLGGAISGLYQRTPATAAQGATLTIGLPGGAGTSTASAQIDYLSPAIRFTSSPTPVVVSDDAELPAPLTLEFPTSYLTSSGFTNTQIFGNYGVTLPKELPLALPGGSTLSIDAARVDMLSNITDSDGTLSFQNVASVGSVNTAARPGVYIGEGVMLDVRGRWTNDAQAALSDYQTTSPLWQNGGRVTAAVTSPNALLSIADDVTFQVSGGAWLNAKGALTAGIAGSLTLTDNAIDGGVAVGNKLAIDGFGVNGSSGGTFNFAAPRIEVIAGSGVWANGQSADDALLPGEVFKVNSSLFSDYGFQTFNLTASGQVEPNAKTSTLLNVDAGVGVTTIVRSLSLNPNPSLRVSAANLDELATVAVLRPDLRPAGQVSLEALPPVAAFNTVQGGGTSAGDIAIGAGASITTDAGGSIGLSSLDSILVDGTLRAPGGSVSLHVLSPSVNNSSYQGFEAGFLPQQRIELGPESVIDVSGTFVSKPANLGVTFGNLSGGGSVSVFADRGVVVTDRGSLISVAGASAAMDVLQASGTYGHEVAASSGGSIAVHSGEAISLLGAIDASAGAPGTSGAAAAGSLDLALTRSESWWGVTTTAAAAGFSNYPLTVQIVPSVANYSVSPAYSNRAVLGAAQLEQSGLDALRLEAGHVVELSGNLSLALNRQLILDAPVLASTGGAVQAHISAPYVEVGYEPPFNSLLATLPVQTATGGPGMLNFSGAEVDLVGPQAVQGSSDVRFSSSGDLLLRGEPLGSGSGTLIGGIQVAGDLTLDAARIFPVTATNYSIASSIAPGVPGTVSIGQTGPNPGTPLSAGSTLSIDADTIVSAGTLYAPFGTILLNAATSLTLADGSTTSVSAGGLTIPYGQTQLGGQQLIYSVFSRSPQVITGVPPRAVNLTAPTITLGTDAKIDSTAAKAVIDLTGGGDLAAFEFVPGSGGTKDRLTGNVSSADFVAGLYAILPSTVGLASPQDPQNASASIGSAESLYVSGGSSLPAGTYPLLPARYALEPGAFLVQIEPQLRSVQPGSLGALADGTPVVAGFLTYGNTQLHQSPGYTGVAVYPGSYANQLAQYNVSLASNYFSAAAAEAGMPRPTLPADAGSLAINVSSALNASSGNVLTAAGTGGLSAPISISARDLVVGNASGAAPADAVNISSAVLAGWKPGSLLLGGTESGNGADINVFANTVTVGSGPAVTADQIVIVANQAIDVQAGATLQSTSALTGHAPSALPNVQSLTLLGSAGTTPALLAASDLNWLIPVRSGEAASAVAATAGMGAASAGASIAIDANSTIASRGALSVDGLGGVTLNGALSGLGAEWSLSSSSIAFTAANTSTDALSIAPQTLAALAGASAVRLASTGAIDIAAPVSLGVGAGGVTTLKSLTLAASGINDLIGNTAAHGNSRFASQSLTLEGAGAGAAAPMAASSPDVLSLAAGNLNIGPGVIAINGFSQTQANASGLLTGNGVGGLRVAGDFLIAASAVTAAPASQTSIESTGALTIVPASNAMAATALPVGGALSLEGGSVDIGGAVAAPSGNLTVTSSGAVTLQTGASLSTAGALVNILDHPAVGTPGGNLSVQAGTDLLLNAASTLDVSGAGSASAGAISLSAGGVASIAANLHGASGPQATAGGAQPSGGSFALDANSIDAGGGGVAALAASLSKGSFTNSVDLRTRTGGLALGIGTELTANTVTLTADTGQIVVGGDIRAPSAALRGALSIFGGAGVLLAASGSLHADGNGAAGLGGTIEIGAGDAATGSTGSMLLPGTASIQLNAGSVVSAAGSAGNGTLLLRAPALTASDAVAIGPLLSDTSAVGRIIVEPVLPFSTANSAIFSSATAPTALDFSTIQGAVTQYMNLAGPALAARFPASGHTSVTIEPGVEIVAPGALTLQSVDGTSPALDLSAAAGWHFNGAPIDLTMRAGGDITVANTISDGIVSEVLGGVAQSTLLPGASASIRLIAGADFSSANPLATVRNGSGSVTIGSPVPGAPNAWVVTGTGDIDLVAAQNVVIASSGSGAYTAGPPAIGPGGTTADPYHAQLLPPKLGIAQTGTNTDGTSYGYGILIPGANALMSFPSSGGNLRVEAGGDVMGAALSAPGVSNWQLRQGGNVLFRGQPVSPQWGVNLAAYDWNFGTLGGGDVRMAAGGNALYVTVAAADSLLPQYGGGPQYVTSGGLSLSAGADIGSAQVFLADGAGTVRAGGALSAVLPSNNITAGDPNVGSAFYLQASSLAVMSRLGMHVDGVFNPTGLGQPSKALPLVGSFLTYSDSAALNLLSVGGDIEFGAPSSASQTLLGFDVYNATSGKAGLGVFPGTLSVAAPNGGISFGAGIGNNGFITLSPAPTGQLDLLAATDIVSLPGDRLSESDAPAGSFATVATPLGGTQVTALQAQFEGAIHESDPNRALITAGERIEELYLSIPKAAVVEAGQDIVDLSYVGQNLHANDATLLSAGRDITYSNSYVLGTGISVGGPGSLDLLAGRNVALNLSQGVLTTGNLLNANLPSALGADLTVATGLGTSADFAGFLTKIIAPSSTYQAQLVAYVEDRQAVSNLTFATAETEFRAFTAEEQRPLIDDVFFNELLLSGRAANATPVEGFSRGYAAIDTLFPGSRTASSNSVAGAYAGDLTLAFSRLYTLSGGNITLTVPGGLINVGLANPPSTLTSRPASALGIVAQNTGNVDIYTRGDVDVNSSRIFTLGGGNILIWSDEGSIDAGRGAKTAISAPPPSVLIGTDGTISINFAGAATGSGIRTIQTEPTTPPGNVDLIAPVGTVNAGDAGIGSAGNINIAAASVIGVSNINFGGTATGVPVQISSISASLSGASAAASSASNSSTAAVAGAAANKEAAAPLSQAALSWLDVFVTGLGEEDCKPNDIECLKRQRAPSR